MKIKQKQSTETTKKVKVGDHWNGDANE